MGGSAMLGWMLLVCTAVTMVTVTGQIAEYQQLTNVNKALELADQRLVALSGRRCQSGTGSITICPFDAGTSVLSLLACEAQFFIGMQSQIVEDIIFENGFTTVPNVGLFTTGISAFFSRGYSLTVENITETGASVVFTLTSVFVPYDARFSYIACDKEITFPY